MPISMTITSALNISSRLREFGRRTCPTVGLADAAADGRAALPAWVMASDRARAAGLPHAPRARPDRQPRHSLPPSRRAQPPEGAAGAAAAVAAPPAWPPGLARIPRITFPQPIIFKRSSLK